MKHILKITTFILLAVFIFLPTRPASASQGVYDGQVVFGQSFTLSSGETLSGDLLVFGGDIDIQAGAIVQGNLVLFGGNLTIDGEVTGTVSATGGQVSLGPAARIGGDLITVAVTLKRAETAQVDGTFFNTATTWSGSENGNSMDPVVTVPEIPVPVITVPEITQPSVSFNFRPFRYVWDVIGNAIFLGLLAMLLMLFLARQSEVVGQAAMQQPLVAGGLGLLSVIVVPVAILLLAITIILIPVALVAALALAVAILFGWIALGYETGRRLTKAFHWQWHPAFSAGLGTFLLTLVVNSAQVLNFIPGMSCFTWILPTLVGLFALGAVIMSRFGTQAPTLPSTAAKPASPATPPSIEEVIPPPAPPVESKRGKKAK